MTKTKTADTVLNYVAAINEHDITKIYERMAPGHVFIDTYAAEVHGRDNMREGWTGYFEWFPDYRIEVTDLLTEEDTAVIIGFAGGTYRGGTVPDKSTYWRLPAAWKVICENGTIKLWQVICDSKIPTDLMSETDRRKVPARGFEDSGKRSR